MSNSREESIPGIETTVLPTPLDIYRTFMLEAGDDFTQAVMDVPDEHHAVFFAHGLAETLATQEDPIEPEYAYCHAGASITHALNPFLRLGSDDHVRANVLSVWKPALDSLDSLRDAQFRSGWKMSLTQQSRQ